VHRYISPDLDGGTIEINSVQFTTVERKFNVWEPTTVERNMRNVHVRIPEAGPLVLSRQGEK